MNTSTVLWCWSEDCALDQKGLPKDLQDAEEIRLTENNWVLEVQGHDAVIKDQDGKEVRRITPADARGWLHGLLRPKS